MVVFWIKELTERGNRELYEVMKVTYPARWQLHWQMQIKIPQTVHFTFVYFISYK